MSKVELRSLLYVLGLLLLVACSNPPDYPVEPIIEYEGLSQTSIRQSSGTTNQLDTLEVRFSFTDGDGDIGDNDSVNVFVTDNRDGFTNIFKISEIPQLGEGKGISGEIALKLTNSPDTKYFCCTFPNSNLACIPSEQFPSDTMSYTIQIRDRAGNMSNTITTETITILCQ